MTETKERINLGIRRKTYLLTKRVFDILVSGFCLVILSPVFLLICALIKLDSKGPAIFKQKRIGKNGQPIYIYKFRSMIDNAEEVLEQLMEENENIKDEYLTNKKLKDDPRITRVGKIIRRSSLDELPQLLNILKGDMTLVGPRPYLYREVEDMTYYDNITKMTPGLTGLWQVSGRSDISFRRRCKLDNEYYQTRGILTDIKIIFKTIQVVVLKKGAE